MLSPFLLGVRLAKDGKQEQGSFMHYRPVNSACGGGGGGADDQRKPVCSPKVRSELLGHVAYNINCRFWYAP